MSVDAVFVGGPLDGQTRAIEKPFPTYHVKIGTAHPPYTDPQASQLVKPVVREESYYRLSTQGHFALYVHEGFYVNRSGAEVVGDVWDRLLTCYRPTKLPVIL